MVLVNVKILQRFLCDQMELTEFSTIIDAEHPIKGFVDLSDTTIKGYGSSPGCVATSRDMIILNVSCFQKHFLLDLISIILTTIDGRPLRLAALGRCIRRVNPWRFANPRNHTPAYRSCFEWNSRASILHYNHHERQYPPCKPVHISTHHSI